MKEQSTFNLGDIVYLRVDGERRGMVIGYTVRPGTVCYEVVWGHDMASRWHYAIELTTEKEYTR